MKIEKAVAIMMANLKGSKNKPSSLLEFSDACRTLLNDREWGIKEMARYFGVSEYMLRQIDKINDLSPNFKKLVSERRLGIEAAYQLWRIKEPKRSQVAKIIPDMTTDEIRSFVHFIHQNPSKTVAECHKLFEKTQPEKIRILAIPLDEEIYAKVKHSADKSKLKIHDYALKILKRYA